MAHPTEGQLRELGQRVLDTLVRMTIKQSESLVEARKRQLGEDYPDYKPGQPGSVNPPMKSGEEMWLQEIKPWIEKNYSWIPDTFATYAKPDEAQFDPLVASLVNGQTYLKPDLKTAGEKWTKWLDPTVVNGAGKTVFDQVGIVNSFVDDWHGTAADAFHENYLATFGTSIGYQHDLMFTLAATLQAGQEIYKRMGADIVNIGEKTIQVLETADDKDIKGTAIALSVLGAVAGIAAAVATGGASILLAAVAATASTASDIVGAQDPPPPPETPIKGSTTLEIIASMTDAISQLNQGIYDQEHKIARALVTINQTVGNMRKQIEIPPPAEFNLMASANYTGITGPGGVYYE